MRKYRIRTVYDREVYDKKKEQLVMKTERNDVHALIGGDGDYIRVGTMNLQSMDDLDSKQKKDKTVLREQMETTPRQDITRAIMRHCYREAIPTLYQKETYWKKMSLHSLRHVFAQAWIKKSNGDFGFVAKRGHWGGIGILEQAYAGKSDTSQLMDTIKYSTNTLQSAEAEALAKVPEKYRETFRLMTKDTKKVDIATKNQIKKKNLIGVETIVGADEGGAGVGGTDDQLQ